MSENPKSWPKISIITPNYNGAAFIDETIKSVLSQEYPNLEYIIIDGGSNDQSVEIIKKHQDQISYWVSETDSGQAAAINKGLSKATGELFNWINSDDILAPGTLETLALTFMREQSNVIVGECQHFENELENSVATSSANVLESTELSLAYYNMGQPAHFYKTEIVKNLGAINETMHYSFDLELWFRYLCKHGMQDVKKIESVLAHFRLHAGSKTVNDEMLFKKEDNQVFARLLNSLGTSPRIIQAFNDDFSTQQNVRWNVDAVNKNEFLKHFSQKWFTIFYLARDFEKAKILGSLALKSKLKLSLLIKLVLLKLNLFVPGIRNTTMIEQTP